MSERTESQILFIGGSADGRRLLVPDDMSYYRVIVSTELSFVIDKHDVCENAFRYDVYKREPLCYGEYARYSVFVLANSNRNVIELLINGYAKRLT